MASLTPRFGLQVAVRDAFDGIAIVECEGEIEAASLAEFEAALRAARSRGDRLVVVDLSRIEFIDLAGFKALLAAERGERSDRRRLAVAGIDSCALAVLRAVEAETLFDTYPTVDAALGTHD